MHSKALLTAALSLLSVTSQAAETLYIRGTFNQWELSHPLVKQSGELASTRIVVKDCYNEFKLGDASWTRGNMFAATDVTADDIVLDQALPLAPAWKSSANLVLMPEKTGEFLFTVRYDANKGEPAAILVSRAAGKVAEESCEGRFPAPYPLALYLKGSFNEWSNSLPLQYQGQNRYEALLELAPRNADATNPGYHEFKISTENWNAKYTFTLANDRKKRMKVGEATALTGADGTEDNNAMIKIEQAGLYKVTLSVADKNAAPELTVTLVKPAK